MMTIQSHIDEDQVSLSLSHIEISKMKIEECWLQIEIVGRRMREEWQQEQHQMPNDRALSLSLSHEREHEEAAAVLCFVVSLLLLLHHHLSCSCALIHSYSLAHPHCLSRSAGLSIVSFTSQSRVWIR